MLFVRDTEGTTANRATAFNSASATAAATITISWIALCPSPPHPIYEEVQQIQAPKLISNMPSTVITLAQATTILVLLQTP